MQINSVTISKRYSDAGYDCRVTINGDYQTMTLKLDQEHTQSVIACVADLIVQGSKQVAENLTKQALDHKAIEYTPPAVQPPAPGDDIPY